MGDPIIVKQDVLPKSSHGQHDRVVATSVSLPWTASPSIVPEAEQAEDKTPYECWVAHRAFEVLNAFYPDHGWHVDCDLAKGGVAIGLPTLMGCEWVYWIRMVDLTPVRVATAGGELLERYRLPRGKFELGSFLEARAKHSILIDRTKKVPE